MCGWSPNALHALVVYTTLSSIDSIELANVFFFSPLLILHLCIEFALCKCAERTTTATPMSIEEWYALTDWHWMVVCWCTRCKYVAFAIDKIVRSRCSKNVYDDDDDDNDWKSPNRTRNLATWQLGNLQCYEKVRKISQFEVRRWCSCGAHLFIHK